MNFQQLRQLIFHCAEKDPWHSFKDPVLWEEVTAALSEDIEHTIAFLQEDPCQETLFWIAPLLPEVSLSFGDPEFIAFLRRYLEEVMDYPYCQENFLTDFMRYVSREEYIETVNDAIDAAEAVLLDGL